MRYPRVLQTAGLLSIVTAEPIPHLRRDSTPTAQVKNGSYYGFYQPNYDQDIFLGIPFAQPPVGELRFQLPQPLNTTWTDQRNATEYSPECYGYGSDDWVIGNVLSEDCLALNVVRPSGTAANASLPVALWIYGGGGYEGGTRDPRYNLSGIVQQGAEAGKPFIGVSINYRLQAFGFLYGSVVQKAGVTNLGYRDQRLALYWVQENIAAFGGDPSKVTIWGESAGASSVGVHLIAYGGRDDGLFRAAVMESGSPATSQYTNATTFDKYYNNITKATNCSSASDTLECLRKVPIDVLSPILNSSVTSGASWGGHIDGDIIQEAGLTQLNAGKFVKVPVLHGRNHDEGTMWGIKGIDTTQQFQSTLTSAGYDNTTVNTLSFLYPDIPAIGIPATLHSRPTGQYASYGAQWKRICAFEGDLHQHAPRRTVSQVWAANNVTSYSYHFNVLPGGVPDVTGVTHFQEVAWVFYNLMGLGYNNSVAKDPFEGVPDTYQQVAKIMARSWASFFVDMDPNNNGGKTLAHIHSFGCY